MSGSAATRDTMTASPSPRVSVVIPAFNAEAYLAETVSSVLAQTFRDCEIVAVNDGSTDGTRSVLAAFGDRLRVIDQENRGLPGARNRGVAEARGEWVAFLDADDLWLPEKLEKQMALVEADPSYELVYTNRYNIGVVGDLPEVQSDVQPLLAGDVFEDLLTVGNVITVSSSLVRRSTFLALGGFDETLRAAEDWDLWLRLTATGRVGVVADPLVRYRHHAQMMSKDPTRMMLARKQVVGKALSSARGRSLPQRTRRRIRAATWNTNAWDAERTEHRALALRWYLQALAWWPSVQSVKGLARIALGRS